MASSNPVDVVSLEGVTIIPVYQFTNDDSPLLLQLRRLDTSLSFRFVDFPILKIACWRVRFGCFNQAANQKKINWILTFKSQEVHSHTCISVPGNMSDSWILLSSVRMDSPAILTRAWEFGW